MAGSTTRDIRSYAHPDKDRANNPPVGLVSPATDPDAGAAAYRHDPHLDPELSWAGKAERTSFEVPTVSLHRHERLDPSTILEAVRRQNGAGPPQPSLFQRPEENPPLRQAIEFYRHRRGWSNRLIAGDSLLVMNSLLEKEGYGGQVQTVYLDPPYGIRYGSNFQPFVNRREVTDGKDDDLTAEPEQIRAFRDTWELGIHSWLTYLRDRLILVRELLTPSGSVFVQIGEENLHRAGVLLDEIFGAENRMATISYATTGGSSANTLPQVANYLLWYAKDRQRAKYRQLYDRLARKDILEQMSWHAMVELEDGTGRPLTEAEKGDPDAHLPSRARLFQRAMLTSQGASTTGRSEPYTVAGRTYDCPSNQQWRVSAEGLDRLHALGRLDLSGKHRRLAWKNYEDEIPGRKLNNVWPDLARPVDKRYVVETATKTVQRALLMTSDPGDLVLDPTCGSGTTAFVAEQWGRRWITCDTSRVALALARQRLLTAHFDWYELAHPDEGVGSGFRYRTVRTVSARTLAYDEPPRETALHDRPFTDPAKARVTGPFTVEAVPAPSVAPIADPPDVAPLPADDSVARTPPTIRQADWRDELLRTGLRGRGGQRLGFARLEPLPGTRWLHADGETRPEPQRAGDAAAKAAEPPFVWNPDRVVVSFGPDHAPLERRQVERALEEAATLVPKPKLVVFAAFQFDPQAAKDIAEMNWSGVTLLKAQMNADLLTDDLRKKRASNESFWLIGQPDILLERLGEGAGGDAGDRFRVSVQGFDYFDMQTGKLESGDANRIALWLLDPDYDGRSLFPRQVFFPLAGEKEGWSRLARNLKAELDPDRIERYRGTVSLPFAPGEHRRVAVKIVDDRGIESLKVVELP